MRPGTDGLTVVLVTFNSADEVGASLTALVAQLRADDEVIVVDNASTDDTVERVRAAAPGALIVPSGGNPGFAGGMNLGVAHATRPLVLLLNPDAVVDAGCVDALRATAATRPAWGAWQALVLLPDGRVNSAGGRVHFLGFGWAGGWGEPASSVPSEPFEVGFASGAALCLRREAWEQTGGFDATYFMYGEDLDLSLRLALLGWGVGLVPAAVVHHDYEFERGSWKWFQLERNRWITVLVTYPTALLVTLAPALLAFELALLPVAAKGGWAGAKLRAVAAALRAAPHIRRRRREVRGGATVGTRAFAAHLTPALDGAYFAGLAGRRGLMSFVASYWNGALRLASRRG